MRVQQLGCIVVATLIAGFLAGCRDTSAPTTVYPVVSGSSTGFGTPSYPETPAPAPVDELGTRNHINDEPDANADRPQGDADAELNGAAVIPPLSEGEFVAFKDGTQSAINELSKESWPNFRNGTALRGIASSELPEELELLWEVPTTDGVTSTAAIADGRTYVATYSGHVLCLNLTDGAEVWRYRTIESDDPKKFAPGFIAPVTISHDAVFIGDEDGKFHVLERETGKVRWTFETGGLIKGGATLLDGDRVMVGSHDGHLYCFNVADGAKVWDVETFGPVNGSQAVAENYTFVTGCDRPFLRIIDIAAGTLHAEVPMGVPPMGVLMIASPALVGDVLYFGTDEGEVVAFDWRGQTIAWTSTDDRRRQQIDSSPAATDKFIVIGTRDRHLLCLNRETGDEAWSYDIRGGIDGSPVIVGERVFFGSTDRNLYAVNLTDGKEVWKHNAGQRFTASPAVGEGRLVIGADGSGGSIFCFGAP